MKKKHNIIKTFSALVNRALLASKLGKQYGTDRDVYEALGYPTTLTYDDYLTHYSRQDIAVAIIDKPVKYTWKGDVLVTEDGKEDNVLKKEWIELDKELKLKSKFIRLDKLTSLGKYGILFLGFDDIQNVEQLKESVKGTSRKLLYVKPYGEGDISISKWESDPTNSRYGLPLLYSIKVANEIENNTSTVIVHYTRVLHVTGELLDSEVEGIPVLQRVYNRLMDLEKLVGGSAEMFWRGAKPGYQTKVDPEYDLSPDDEDDLKDQLDEYEHNLRRFLTIQGVDVKAMEMQVADPQNHVDVQLQMISAASGIPKRILVGSERGELASTQDKVGWLEEIQSRREEFAEEQIIKEFVQVCMKYGVLPKIKEYKIEWEDLFAPSEKEKAEVGKVRAGALKDYASNPVVESIVTPEAFFKFFLGLTQEQVSSIMELRDGEMTTEQQEIEEAEEEEI